MSINRVNGPGFNPYAASVGTTPSTTRPTGTTPRPLTPSAADGAQPSQTANPLAAAIKQDASSRAALVNSADAPPGVDQELWSVLTKEERGFFVKAGAMGPLTYGRFTPAQTPTPAPIVRGGRLDIKA
jgi:hypothetical protein